MSWKSTNDPRQTSTFPLFIGWREEGGGQICIRRLCLHLQIVEYIVHFALFVEMSKNGGKFGQASHLIPIWEQSWYCAKSKYLLIFIETQCLANRRLLVRYWCVVLVRWILAGCHSKVFVYLCNCVFVYLCICIWVGKVTARPIWPKKCQSAFFNFLIWAT